MAENYEYPLIEGISVSEISDLIAFYNAVEAAYETNRGIARDDFKMAYERFRDIVPAKSEQRQLQKKFAEASGFEAYTVIKQFEQTDAKFIKVGDGNE